MQRRYDLGARVSHPKIYALTPAESRDILGKPGGRLPGGYPSIWENLLPVIHTAVARGQTIIEAAPAWGGYVVWSDPNLKQTQGFWNA
jgi:hypothetical protein